MHRDPNYFPDYDEFRPERYLDESGELADPIPDTHTLGHLSYGCGRRFVSMFHFDSKDMKLITYDSASGCASARK